MPADTELRPVVLDAGNPSVMTGAGNRTYLLPSGDDCAMLIDAGVGQSSHLRALSSALDAMRSSLASVIVTHGHGDHIDGAPAIAAQHASASFMKYPWPDEDTKAMVRWQPLEDGAVLPRAGGGLRVIHTPGHAPDHCVLWHEASKSVFSGDLVIPGGSVVIQTRRGGRMGDYLASLERLRAMTPHRLFPAHGDPVDQPVRLLTFAIEHRLQREAQVLDALAVGPGTIAAIAESIYHGLPLALMPAAQENVRAHLEKLRDERRATLAHGRWQR